MLRVAEEPTPCTMIDARTTRNYENARNLFPELARDLDEGERPSSFQTQAG